MKVVSAQNLELEACLRTAQAEAVVITKKGKPVALLCGVEGMDLEQLELSQSAKFWKLIRERRKEKTTSRADLERKLAESSSKRHGRPIPATVDSRRPSR